MFSALFFLSFPLLESTRDHRVSTSMSGTCRMWMGMKCEGEGEGIDKAAQLFRGDPPRVAAFAPSDPQRPSYLIPLQKTIVSSKPNRRLEFFDSFRCIPQCKHVIIGGRKSSRAIFTSFSHSQIYKLRSTEIKLFLK